MSTAQYAQLRLFHLSTAPLHHGEAGSLHSGQGLGNHFHRGFRGLPGHKDPNQGVRCRIDLQRSAVRIGIGLERNQVIRILLHQGQPVDDKLIGLPSGQAQDLQGLL